MNQPHVERIGDAQLTSINVNAATPDVLNRICTEICDKVMAQIPPEAIEKIAGEVIAQGKIVYREKVGPHYSPRIEETEIAITNAVKKQLGNRLVETVNKIVEKWWTKPEVGELIQEAASHAFTQAVADLPKILTANFCNKILGAINGNQADVVEDLVQHAMFSGERLEDLRQTLMNQTQLQLNNEDGRSTWYCGRPIDDGIAKAD